jgi:hypothetical protein
MADSSNMTIRWKPARLFNSSALFGAVAAIVTAVMSSCGEMPNDPRVARSCAQPPAGPVGVDQAGQALRAAGVPVSKDASICGVGADYIVTGLRTKNSDVFCNVNKAPQLKVDLVRDKAIVDGPSWTGHAREVVYANVDCNIYTSDTRPDATSGRVIQAMRALGGQDIVSRKRGQTTGRRSSGSNPG